MGGWAIDSVARVRSGFPISVVENEQYQGIALANAFRPDRLLDQPIWIDDACGARRQAPQPGGLSGGRRPECRERWAAIRSRASA